MVQPIKSSEPVRSDGEEEERKQRAEMLAKAAERLTFILCFSFFLNTAEAFLWFFENICSVNFYCENVFLISRRAKDDKLKDEESRIRVDTDKSLENLREKMQRELENMKLDLLEVRFISINVTL